MLAPEQRIVGIVLTVPAKFAKRLAEVYKLTPPVDVRSLLRQYADVVDAVISIKGVDGVCLNLKVPGKRARVVINSSNHRLRRRFTEAHELGHIVIPWHWGTIVDHLDPNHIEAKGEYWVHEDEANQFAAEILMPSGWLSRLLTSTQDLSECHVRLCHDCEVSAQAAAKRLSSQLPPNIIFVSERGGMVEFSGRTSGTLASAPIWGVPFEPSIFHYADLHQVSVFGHRRLHWWTLPHEIKCSTTDLRPWREVLDAITADLDVPLEKRKRFKMSVNGVLSLANSTVKREGTHTAEAVVAACLQRFNGRDDLFGIANHPNFMDFVIKRAEELTRPK